LPSKTIYEHDTRIIRRNTEFIEDFGDRIFVKIKRKSFSECYFRRGELLEGSI